MPQRPLLVLLAEDDPATATLVREAIATGDLPISDIVDAGSAAAAERAWASVPFDVAVVGAAIDDGRGLRFARQVLADDPHALVVILARTSTRELEDQAAEIGVADLIETAHVTPRTMARMLRSAWRRRAQSDALAEARRHLTQTFNHAAIAMAILELDGTIVDANPAMTRLTGHDAADLCGRPIMDFSHAADHDATSVVLKTLDAAGEIVAPAGRWRHATGQEIWVQLHRTVLEHDGHPWRLLVQAVDVTRQLRVEARLQHLADHDPLTGLANRRAFERIVADARRDRRSRRSTLLLIDLDEFKAVNDTHGHDAGDELLRAVAEALTGQLRDADVAARIGGDEFAVLLRDVDPATDDAVAGRICEAIAQAALAAGHAVTASVGGIRLDGLDGHDDLVDAFAAADRALYLAKARGRNTYAFD